MRKVKKIVLAFAILGFMLFLVNTSEVRAQNAAGEKTIEYNKQVNTKMLEEIKTTRFKALITPRVKVEASINAEDITKYYYNQLQHDVSRNTYNALSSQVSNKVTVNLNGYTFDVENPTDDALTECFSTNLLPYVLDGYEAFIMDGSKNYWWTPEDIQFGELKADVLDDKATFKTIQIIANVEEWSDHENFNTRFEEICNSISGDSVYEIVRDINYYIYNNVEYKILDGTSIEQTAYGALMLNQAVCEGQAQLFNLMCREKGILSLNIYGYTSENNIATAHAWNYVYEPSREQWYAVDVTWNSQYKDSLYFMVGSDTIVNGVKFGKNHIAGFKQFVLQTYIPATPTLSQDKYIDTISIDGDYIINIQPDTKYTDFLKEFGSGTEFTVNENGNMVTGENLIKTGQVLTASNVSYTLVVLGDTNGDGKANINDIMQINKHRLNINQLDGEYNAAGDVNKDGTINIQDILELNKYRLKKITEF